LREFLADTVWGELDYLLVDLPPGAHGFCALAQLVPNLGGVIVVTIPSQVSRQVVTRSVGLARELGMPLIGWVENMAGYTCPHCHGLGDLFHAGWPAEVVARELDLPYLGSIPIDPRISVSTDWGVPFALEYGDSPAGGALISIAQSVAQFLGEDQQ
jgi:ATP-binding protein involved in chromosome partitioning